MSFGELFREHKYHLYWRIPHKHVQTFNHSTLVIDRTLFLPNRTEPFFCRTMFGRTERFGQGSANMAEPVRPYWPNLFGRIGRTSSVVFAEHARPYWPNKFGYICRTCSANLASLVRFKCPQIPSRNLIVDTKKICPMFQGRGHILRTVIYEWYES